MGSLHTTLTFRSTPQLYCAADFCTEGESRGTRVVKRPNDFVGVTIGRHALLKKEISVRFSVDTEVWVAALVQRVAAEAKCP